MKDFLKDVPKLENDVKVLHRGDTEVFAVRCREGSGTNILINHPICGLFWEFEKHISPIPELTHWEASDFHKWFAENGMEDFYVRGISTFWYKPNAISKEFFIAEDGDLIACFDQTVEIKKVKMDWYSHAPSLPNNKRPNMGIQLF